MSKTLVVVESATKATKIQKFLGPSYIVMASYGHIMDLDPSKMSVDIENGFVPEYISNSSRQVDTIKKMKAAYKDCTEVLLAADKDREGEMIASNIATVLKLKKPKRIVFTEITKAAITQAIANPVEIDQAKVDAQKARRILDRIVGYKISPILWKVMQKPLSAGRVQSL